MSMKLSVCLAVHNEENTIGRCLDSIKDIADEIVVVDGKSTDKTVDIVKKYKANIIHTDNHENFHINKQLALEKCKGDWILQLDADEVVSKELATQIEMVIQGKTLPNIEEKKQRLFARHAQNIFDCEHIKNVPTQKIVAYFIPRLNFFLRGYLRHGGVYPDGVIRLVRNGKAHFPCKSVHEQIAIDGRIGWLSADLLHYGDPSFDRYLKRANAYTSLTAKKFAKENISFSFMTIVYYMFIKPCMVWFSLFFRHKGFLDGVPGFVFSLFSGLHYPIAYMKYWEASHAQ